MINGFWHYKVTWYFDGALHHNQGFVYADTYAEAADKIDRSYDEIHEMTITGMDAYDVLDFEDILDFMGAASESSCLGPQLVAAIQDAIAIEQEAQ
jgi:hypothetical protein